MKAIDIIKKSRINNLAITRNLNDFDKDTDNIYESVSIMSKRANQIAMELKDEFHEKTIDYVTTANDSLEETFENIEQIEMARYFEQLPKPTLLAIDEFENNGTHFKRLKE